MRSKAHTKSWYIKKLDKLFSLHIRSKGYCEKCGSRDKTLQCAHISSRRNMTLRWDDNNALCLCIGCHIYWAHKNPREFTHWFDDMFPEKAKYLDTMKNVTIKRTLVDYQKLYEKLQSKVV